MKSIIIKARIFQINKLGLYVSVGIITKFWLLPSTAFFRNAIFKEKEGSFSMKKKIGEQQSHNGKYLIWLGSFLLKRATQTITFLASV